VVSRAGPPPEQRPVSRIYRVNLETSSLSGWVGATAAALQPLVDALATHVVASDTLHVDDTGVPVLAPGTGQDQDRAAVDSCARRAAIRRRAAASRPVLLLSRPQGLSLGADGMVVRLGT